MMLNMLLRFFKQMFCGDDIKHTKLKTIYKRMIIIKVVVND